MAAHLSDAADAAAINDTSLLDEDPEEWTKDPLDEAEADGEDAELDAIKARVREMEEEAMKLKDMQSEVDRHLVLGGSLGAAGGYPSPASSQSNLSYADKLEVDARSVYVGNVDYGATADELEAHFHGCGSINRVTILCNKFDGNPKGFAYVEFSDKDSVNTAMALDESLFRGRQIKVMPKRTNKPGISSTNRPPRGRGLRGRIASPFRGRGGFAMRRPRYRGRSSYYPY